MDYYQPGSSRQQITFPRLSSAAYLETRRHLSPARVPFVAYFPRNVTEPAAPSIINEFSAPRFQSRAAVYAVSKPRIEARQEKVAIEVLE